MYFVISDMALVDPMYQFSLKFVKRKIIYAMEIAEANKDQTKRLEILKNSITKVIYSNICRGLFEAHKLIFSFLISINIEKDAKRISDNEWNALIRGAGVIDSEKLPA